MTYKVKRTRKRPAEPRPKPKRAAKRRPSRGQTADARRAALWWVFGCG